MSIENERRIKEEENLFGLCECVEVGIVLMVHGQVCVSGFSDGRRI